MIVVNATALQMPVGRPIAGVGTGRHSSQINRERMTQHYVGTKQVLAYEHEKDGKPGYQVQYENGHTSWSPKEVFEAVYIPIGHVGHLSEFHQDVIGERALLADKLNKLVAYTGSEKFLELDSMAQIELNTQLDYMLSYRRSLDERLIALNKKES